MDKENLSNYFNFRTYLTERFKDKQLSVFAGHIDTDEKHKYKGCKLCANEWRDFTIAQYRHLSKTSTEEIYPLNNIHNVCSANTLNSFVIGPKGEIYKCWEDVGKGDMIVGTIFNDEYISNSELVTLYSTGTDPYLDTSCLDCNVLPICGGGCANKRLRAKHFHEDGLNFCSLYKNNLTDFLLEYYDLLLTKEMCAELLSTETKFTTKKIKGFEVLHSGLTEK